MEAPIRFLVMVACPKICCMKIILVLASTLGSLTLNAQVDLTKRISITVNNATLQSFFELLEEKCGSPVTFGTDNIPNQLRISISVTNKPIAEIIEMICTEHGLQFIILNGAIVFKYPRPLPVKAPIVQRVSTIKSDDKITTHSDSSRHSAVNSFTIRQHIPSPDDTSLTTTQNIVPLSSGSKETSLLKVTEKKSDKPDHRIGLFVSYARDHNHYHFYSRELTFQQYEVNWSPSFSAGVYGIILDKVYASLAIGYASKDFALNYNYQVLDPNDPLPIPYQTQVRVRYLEIPFTLGYRVLQRKSLSLCVAGGFYPSFLIEESEKTTYLNQGEPSTKHFINNNRQTLYSATAGFIVHYSVSHSFGIFLEPNFMYFHHTVNGKAMQPHASLYRIKTGLQFSLARTN